MGRRRLRNWRGRDDKVWPVERWVQLLHRLHEHMPDAMLVLRGADAEMPLLESIRAATALPCVASASTGLRPLFALCEVAHSMISADSGPAHSAAALGVPLVVLYGTQSRKVWLPRSSNGSPVLGVGGPPEYQRAEQISIETVFSAWRRATAGDAPSGRAAHGHAAAQAAAQADFEPPPAPLSTQMRSVRIEPSALQLQRAISRAAGGRGRTVPSGAGTARRWRGWRAAARLCAARRSFGARDPRRCRARCGMPIDHIEECVGILQADAVEPTAAPSAQDDGADTRAHAAAAPPPVPTQRRQALGARGVRQPSLQSCCRAARCARGPGRPIPR